jgi:hypothetical protein
VDINQEILQRITRVETKLDLFASAKDTAIEALSISKDSQRRIDKLERVTSWFIAIIVGGVLVSIVNMVIN